MSILSLSCSNKPVEKEMKMPMLFDTKEQAEKEAYKFDCERKEQEKYDYEALENNLGNHKKESSYKFSAPNIFNSFNNITASRAFDPFNIFCISEFLNF